MKQGTNILITGGFGFIGYFLAKRILEKDEHASVTLLGHMRFSDADIFNELQKKYGARIKFDIRDIQMMDETWYKDVDQIYHLAAKKTTTADDGDTAVLELNLKMDDALLYSMFGRKPECKLLYVSTGEVYGPLWERIAADNFTWPVPERNGLVGINIYDARWMYALSKIVGEAQVMHDGGDFRWSIARLQNPYGPRMGDDTLIPRLFKANQTSQQIKVFANDTRPYIYVEDVADAFITIMNSTATDGKVINVAGDEMEVADMVAAVSRQLTGGVDVVFERREEHMPNHRRALSTTELRSLGWRPWVSIEEGVRKTLDYYRSKIKP